MTDLRLLLFVCLFASCTGESPDVRTPRQPGAKPEPEWKGTLLYPAGQTHSPVDSRVAAAWRETRSWGPDLADDVFMKVGASSTVSLNTLYCFGSDQVFLGGAESLRPTLEYFLNGDAAGTNPFERVTQAARSGRTANWALSGEPSPVQMEFETLMPGLAIIHYGTNDMQMGSTYASAMPGFYESMSELLDWMEFRGVLPIVTGISHRGDKEEADRWVATYNALLRGMAQARDLPFIDLHAAMDPLVGHGLASDGLHLNLGPYPACDLREDALAYGYNQRNLIVLEALARVRSVLQEGENGLDGDALRLVGEGTLEEPAVIPALPFSDARDTYESGQYEWDSQCGGEPVHGGPEWVYQLELSQSTAIRALVMDRGATDVDLMLLNAEGQCLKRADTRIEMTLSRGVYTLVVDTFVDSSGFERSGPFQLMVVACDDGDVSCAG